MCKNFTFQALAIILISVFMIFPSFSSQIHDLQMCIPYEKKVLYENNQQYLNSQISRTDVRIAFQGTANSSFSGTVIT